MEGGYLMAVPAVTTPQNLNKNWLESHCLWAQSERHQYNLPLSFLSD